MGSPEFFRLSQMLQPLLGAMQSSPDQVETPDVAGRMNQLYTPEHIASDRLNELIGNMPQRNEPGLGRKIMAGVSAFSPDPNAVERTLYAPYHRELADWKEQLNPAVQSANFERAGNTNERQIANLIALQEGRDRTFDQRERRNTVLERQGDERIGQAERRTRLAEARLDITRQSANGGQLAINKDTGKAHMVYKDGTTKPIPALNDASREDILELQQEFALERIETGAQNRPTPRDRMRTEVIDDPENPGHRILVTINMDTNEVTPATIRKTGQPDKTVEPTVRTEETESNKLNRINRMALQIKNTRPEWGKYIEMKNGKLVRITPPGLLNRMTPELFQEIATAIGIDNPSPPKQTTQPNTSTNKGTTRADGKTHVKRKADGVTGWVTNPDPKLYEVIP